MKESVFLLEVFFVFSLFMFLMVKSHFLMALLFLEMMSMIFFFMVLNMSFMGDGGVMILFLCMMVLEGAFGLSLVVSNSRSSGGDFLFLYSN